MKHTICFSLLGTCLMLPASTLASCGAYGVCGTIVFLGKTADRSKAVFLSTTSTRGQYDVSPTSGTFPVDTWVTSGADTRISLSSQVAEWGGTHALNYYPVEGGPIGSRVYIAGATQSPNGTVYPNDYRPPGRNTPLVAGGVTATSLPAALHVQVLPAATVVERQTPQGPVVAPMEATTVAVQSTVVAETVRGPTVPDTSGLTPGDTTSQTIGPTISQNLSAQSGQQAPQVRVSPLQNTPSFAVRQVNTGPQVAPQAGQTVAIQSPQAPDQVRGPSSLVPPSISTHKTTSGPVVVPPGLLPAVVQGPRVPPLVQPPREPVTGGGTVAVLTPPGGTHSGELPKHPPPHNGGQVTTGANLRPTGTVTPKEPQQPPTGSTTERLPNQEVQRWSALRQVPPAWRQPGGPCIRQVPQPLAQDDHQPRCDGDDESATLSHWIDISTSRTRDNTSGLVLRQRGEALATGLDKAVSNDLSVGLYVSGERQRGTLLDDLLQFRNQHSGVGAYVTRHWQTHWDITAGLHVGDETVSVEFLGFSGRFKTRTWTASAGLVGTHAMGDTWLVSRVNLEHAWKRTGSGAVTGEVSGARLDIATSSSSESFWVTSAGVEVGARLSLRDTVVVPSVDVAVNRVAHGSRRSNPWGVDVRLGVRVHWKPTTSLLLSHQRTGVNRRDHSSSDWHAMFVHRF